MKEGGWDEREEDLRHYVDPRDGGNHGRDQVARVGRCCVGGRGRLVDTTVDNILKFVAFVAKHKCPHMPC